MHATELLLFPLVVITEKIAGLLAGLVGPPGEHGMTPHVTREDLQAIAELAVEQGLVPETSGLMLCTVFELDTKPVSTVMTPFVDVFSVPLDATVEDVETLSVTTGFSRFPVYHERVDEIIGIVDLRHLLYSSEDSTSISGKAPIADLVERNIVFVPETKPVGSLLHEVRYQKVPMTVVIDEHGGVIGVVTTEDLIEEVVGEIQDERDHPIQQVQRVADSVYECDGKLEIRELSDRLGIKIRNQDFETAGGLVLKLAGRIPAVGERFSYQDFDIEVLQIVRRRIARLRFIRRNAARKKSR